MRPDTASSAASEPWLSLREWRRGAGGGGAGARGSPGAPSRKASSSVEERSSSAPSSRKPSSRRVRLSSPVPANSASSGELSRESWWLELEAREMSMRGAAGVCSPAAGVECERARCSGGASAAGAAWAERAGSSRISGNRNVCFVSGLDCKQKKIKQYRGQ